MLGELYLIDATLHENKKEIKYKKPQLQTDRYNKIVIKNMILNKYVRKKWYITEESKLYVFVTCCKSYIIARKLTQQDVFYYLPINSKLVDIFKSNGQTKYEEMHVPMEEIKYKLFSMSIDDDIVFAPLRHGL